MKKTRIYLDNNATTPLDPGIKPVLIEFLNSFNGNPSSIHAFGQDARALLDQCRRTVASHLGVLPHEVIFTSSGSEAMNFLIRGLLEGKGEIITSNIEHSCVKQTLKHFAQSGFKITELKTGLLGKIDPEDLKSAITSETKLIVLMAANNETGVKNDLELIAQYAKEAGVPCVVDGVALLGKEPIAIPHGVTGMGFSGHKIHALQGVGVAVVRSKKIRPTVYGSQEYGLRGGTENLVGILSFAEAVKLLKPISPVLRDYFESSLIDALPGVAINGMGPRIPNTSNLSFDGVDGESLLIALDQEGIAASHGSACSAGALELSPVLLNMGIPPQKVRSSLRFSFSRFTSEEEIKESIGIIKKLVLRLRKIS